VIRAYRLYTGADGDSHVEVGSVTGGEVVGAQSVMFKESPAHASFDWHNDPIPQYVITLSGVLEFTTVGGETFTLRPGDVLLAEDHTGSGHKWRMINDEPWRRAYVVFEPGANTHFVADPS
jgi:quercetin dioxygenase-like cupin family protein